MRILHFLAERGYSGGEVQLRLLLEHLLRRGHHNAVALVPGARFAAVARELNVAVFEVPLRQPWWPWTWRAARRAVREVAPDVVHFGCGRSLLWAGWMLRALPLRLRITTRRIDYDIGRSWHRGGRYRGLVDHVVANCEAVRQRVLAAGVPAERVTLVHEGIEVERWQGLGVRREAARARLGLDPEALVVSCAATLRPRKGQRVLVAAFAGVAAAFRDAVLVLAGTGSDGAGLERIVRRLGLGGRVLLPGAVHPVADLYAASDVFCMASRNEGLSNACLEASAAGLPLVVTRAGGLPEIVLDGVTGAVVPPDDPAALGRALARFLGDRELRQRAGAAGAARTGKLFTAERMAERMENLLLSLVR